MRTFIRSQRGITLIGFIIALVVTAFFFLIGAKLFPAYNEYHAVVKAMDAVKTEAGGPNRTLDTVWRSLDRKFNISYVSTPTKACLTLDRRKGEVTCTYDYTTKFVYNIDFVVHFTHTIKL
jgi:Tfp pilus assembly protein PilE